MATLRGRNYMPGTIVAQVNVILNIEVSPPVANFRCPTQLRNSQNGTIILIVDFNSLLDGVRKMFAIG